MKYVISTVLIAVCMAAQAATDVSEAKILFNNKCAHCHGANGASAVQERNLTKLQIRYQDSWPQVARDTITNGRTESGMPVWGGTLSDQQIRDIIEFLKTIQR